jgi:hypothetical protein
MPSRTEPRDTAARAAPTPPTAPDAGGARFGAGAPLVPPAPPKLRRRNGLVAVGVALICLGGAAAAYLTTAVGNTSPVLAMRQAVERGAVIEPEDLTVARISTDPALQTVPESQRDTVAGQRAAVDLPAGAILTPQATTTEVVPARGQSLVAVTLTPAQLPSQPLVAGDAVRVVASPREQDDPPAATPASYPATVVAVRELTDTGQVVVDVTVPAAGAGQLAAQVATGRIALVLDSGAR